MLAAIRRLVSTCLLSITCVFIMAAIVCATSALPPPTNVRITNIPQLNNEEQVFICPTDPNIVIANWRDFRLGYRQIGIGRSTNGGASWIDSLIAPEMQYFNLVTLFSTTNWQSDPTMTVDRFGNFYMCVLDFVPGNNDDSSVISFYKSTDKGVSWTGPFINVDTVGPFFEDKQFITADRTGGLYDGNLYCSWTRFPNPDRIIVIRSTDGGLTFQDTVVVGPIQTSTGCSANIFDAGQFSIPIVNSDGSLHVLWQGTVLDSGAFCSAHTAIKHVVSTDGGASFTYEDTVITVSGYTSANGGFSTYSMPVGDADITGGPFDGSLYISFTNRGDEDLLGHTDVDFIRSTDNGLTWSPRLQINDDSASESIDNFHPWLICNEEGVLIAVFYDQRVDVGPYTSFDLFASYSFDGGETFTTNHRVSSASSNPGFLRQPTYSNPYKKNPDGSVLPTPMEPMAGRLGEYICVSANFDKILAVWTDTRNFNSEVYSANWNMPLLEPRLLSPAKSGLVGGSPTLRWATSWKNNQDRYRVELSLNANMSSPLFSGSTDTASAPLGALADGVYYWRVKTFNNITMDSSLYSPVWSFTVDATPPSAPNLLVPTNGSSSNNPLPTFDWSDATDAHLPIVYDLYLSTGISFPVGPSTTVYGNLPSSSYSPSLPLTANVPTYWKVIARDAANNESVSSVFQVSYAPYVCGDADASSEVDISDAVYLIAYIFQGGPAPIPLQAGDADGSGEIDIGDVSYLIAYIFQGGPAPICP